jgi:2-polyprenyl-6-hydroxyphenyl methylase/3-demethylubiquinone-9 3-methyltransferase
VDSLGQFDVVYSWGVLHHTGALWSALDSVAGLVAPGGLLYISIYNDQGLESRMWTRVKRSYNLGGPFKRRVLLTLTAAYLRRRRALAEFIRIAVRVRDITRRVAGKPGPVTGRACALTQAPRRARGMSAKHDMVDWVGGYPFEVAKPEEVFAYIRPRGFELRHLKTCAGGIGCNEFVFERRR